MKYLSSLLFILLISACCSKEESVDCIDSKYDQELTVELGDVVCFDDGNSFEVRTIADEFCCCLCDCIWAGQLSVIVETTDSNDNKELFKFGSDSYNNGDEIFSGYVIRDFDFLYNNQSDALPLCEGEYNASKVELIFKISKK
jgi:hypothetical protein